MTPPGKGKAEPENLNLLLMRFVLREPGSPTYLEDEGKLVRAILAQIPDSDAILSNLWVGWRSEQCVAITPGYIRTALEWHNKADCRKLLPLHKTPEPEDPQTPGQEPDEQGFEESNGAVVPGRSLGEIEAELDRFGCTLPPEFRVVFAEWKKKAGVEKWQTPLAKILNCSPTKVSNILAKLRTLVANHFAIQDPDSLIESLATFKGKSHTPPPPQKVEPRTTLRETLLQELARREEWGARWQDYIKAHRAGRPGVEISTAFPDDETRLQELHRDYCLLHAVRSRENARRGFLTTLRTDKVSLVQALAEELREPLEKLRQEVRPSTAGEQTDLIDDLRRLAREGVGEEDLPNRLGLKDPLGEQLTRFYRGCRLQGLARQGIPEEELPNRLGISLEQFRDLLKQFYDVVRRRRRALRQAAKENP